MRIKLSVNLSKSILKIVYYKKCIVEENLTTKRQGYTSKLNYSGKFILICSIKYLLELLSDKWWS